MKRKLKLKSNINYPEEVHLERAGLLKMGVLKRIAQIVCR